MSWKRREILRTGAALVGTALMPAPGFAGRHGLTELRGRTFGTDWRALLPGETEAPRLATEIDRLLASLERTMSPFLGGSELSRLNAAARPMPVSPPLAAVVREGLRIAAATGGAFDPTVGPDVARFGFGPIMEAAAYPGGSRGYRGLSLRGRTVHKVSPTLTFDPCGIGKGYALDAMGVLLASHGLTAFFAEFGGEILVRGRHPAGRNWRVGIEEPRPGPVRVRHTLRLAKGALATSSDRVNGYVVGGRRYSHIVDPQTARPVRNRVASVSVVAGSAMTADALATALMVMGPDRGLAFADRASLPVLYVLHDGEGFRDVATPSFAASVEL